MRSVSRRSLLGLQLHDCNGLPVGQVVDTWPDDGGGEVELVVVRLPRLGERRMLPAAAVEPAGGVARTRYSRVQVEDAPAVDGGRHGADDPYRARSYWMFEEPPGTGMLTGSWRRRSGFSATGKRFPTTPSPTPTAS